MELTSTPDAPAPSGGIVGSVVSSSGVKIRFARWRQTARRCRGTVCIIQGRSEFIEKYFEVVTDLRRRGFAVLAFDWRGQGGSDRLLLNGRKGHVDDFSDYADDLDAVVDGVLCRTAPSRTSRWGIPWEVRSSCTPWRVSPSFSAAWCFPRPCWRWLA